MRDEFEDQDDYAATRAGDLGATTALPNGQPTPRPSLGASGLHSGSPNQYPYTPRSGVAAPTPGAPVKLPVKSATPPPTTTRYCGTCGAALEPGRPFCGQCGTPVTTSGVHGTAKRPAPSASGLYRQSGADWDDVDGDAPTVAEMPMGELYGGYGGAYGDDVPADDSSRALRIIVGVLCLIGSFATAVAAIVIALNTFH
jgi:hypothetical protein